MRHETLPKARPRPVTNRRFAAAKRALRRERDKHPLFADQVAEEQPAPEQRIAEHEADNVAHWQRIRDHAAETWRAARRLLQSLPSEEKDRLLAEWNASSIPARSEYFADFLWRRTGKRIVREKKDDDGQQSK